MNVQGSIFDDENVINIPLLNGEMDYYPKFFSEQESNALMQALRASLDWKQESMKLYGKDILFPRLMAWYGDAGSNYSFSGRNYTPVPWTTELLEIRNRLTPLCGKTFNSVLANLYRNGNDAMGWHADDEPELGPHPIIASVNFGATRKFRLRYKNNHQLTYELPLSHGSLLVMKGTLQEFWEHQIPKTKKVLSERINLTFRHITP
ncbi:alpha-ketoglutarate-dependent dioxygenase AlkB [Chitinophaga silvatica]|uniref:Alpha-ketoglutarate-dependent dioxygenase AlkB n=1 Tax=Chitinophaga silvatica TaxID=2282649 RepID=A0A3E1YBX6_9BACT|nr:alpha-ketoglutarate-dependent dioxygenase AlkB [Chitinophaga silvatica]RFS23304.1 alpha-ketoglutarate-dependent dioxygenase AlkB [Chitinophaga silvatica]